MSSGPPRRRGIDDRVELVAPRACPRRPRARRQPVVAHRDVAVVVSSCRSPASRLNSVQRGGFGPAPSARVPTNWSDRSIISASVFGYFGPSVARYVGDLHRELRVAHGGVELALRVEQPLRDSARRRPSRRPCASPSSAASTTQSTSASAPRKSRAMPMRAPFSASAFRILRVVASRSCPSLFAVAASAGSTPVMTPSATATSYTLRAIGPAGVEAERQRDDAVAAEQAVRRLEADDAVRRRRPAHRAAGVGAEAERRVAGGDRRAGAARRARRRARRDRAGWRLAAERAEGAARRELRQVDLGEDDRAGLAQLLHDEGVVGRHRSFEQHRAAGGRQVDGVEVVLEHDRDAVQRRARCPWPCARRRARAPCSSAFGLQRDDGVQQRALARRRPRCGRGTAARASRRSACRRRSPPRAAAMVAASRSTVWARGHGRAEQQGEREAHVRVAWS